MTNGQVLGIPPCGFVKGCVSLGPGFSCRPIRIVGGYREPCDEVALGFDWADLPAGFSVPVHHSLFDFCSPRGSSHTIGFVHADMGTDSDIGYHATFAQRVRIARYAELRIWDWVRSAVRCAWAVRRFVMHDDRIKGTIFAAKACVAERTPESGLIALGCADNIVEIAAVIGSVHALFYSDAAARNRYGWIGEARPILSRSHWCATAAYYAALAAYKSTADLPQTASVMVDRHGMSMDDYWDVSCANHYARLTWAAAREASYGSSFCDDPHVDPMGWIEDEAIWSYPSDGVVEKLENKIQKMKE